MYFPLNTLDPVNNIRVSKQNGGEVKKTKRKTPTWHADDETKINQFQIIKTIDVHVFNISKNSSSAVCVCDFSEELQFRGRILRIL